MSLRPRIGAECAQEQAMPLRDRTPAPRRECRQLTRTHRGAPDLAYLHRSTTSGLGTHSLPLGVPLSADRLLRAPRFRAPIRGHLSTPIFAPRVPAGIASTPGSVRRSDSVCTHCSSSFPRLPSTGEYWRIAPTSGRDLTRDLTLDMSECHAGAGKSRTLAGCLKAPECPSGVECQAASHVRRRRHRRGPGSGERFAH